MTNNYFESCTPRKYMATKSYLKRGCYPKELRYEHLFKEICVNCGDAFGFHMNGNTCPIHTNIKPVKQPAQ